MLAEFNFAAACGHGGFQDSGCFFGCCPIEGGLPAWPLHHGVCPGMEQKLDAVHFAGLRSQVQRGVALLIHLVYVAAFPDAGLQHSLVAGRGCFQHGINAVAAVYQIR